MARKKKVSNKGIPTVRADVETDDYTADEELYDLAEDVKRYDRTMETIRRAAFYAYSRIDFSDLAEMLNYRKTKFEKIGPDDKKSDSIEAKYICSMPGEYTAIELQGYVYAALQEALNRFKSELYAGCVDTDPDACGEYFNWSSGILCHVDKHGVEISYRPIEAFACNDEDEYEE